MQPRGQPAPPTLDLDGDHNPTLNTSTTQLFNLHPSPLRPRQPVPSFYISTMATRRLASMSTKRVWLGDKGVYPIIGIIAGGSAYCVYRGIRHSTTSPDVHWTQESRTTAAFMRDNFEEGRKYREAAESGMVKDSVNNLQHNCPPIMKPLYNLWRDDK
mgnify:CR=1 FL=1